MRTTAGSYVGLDLNAAELAQVARSISAPTEGRSPPAFIEANAYRLPCRERAFSAVVVIRVFHHFGRPAEFLAELARCTVPGARLLLQYNPKPTVGTLVMDLRRGLRPSTPNRPGVTWSRSPMVRIPGERFPIYVLTASAVRAAVEGAGFRVLSERGTGVERMQRWFPSMWQRTLPAQGPLAALLPSRFLLCERTSTPTSGTEVSSTWLACPRCRTPMSPGPESSSWTERCPQCGFSIESDGSVIRARYTPSGE